MSEQPPVLTAELPGRERELWARNERIRVAPEALAVVQFEPGPLIERLVAARVEFVVIGGFAVIAHG